MTINSTSNNIPISQDLSDFLSEAEPYIDHLDTLNFSTVAELYDLFNEAAKVATKYIDKIDPELRVNICEKQDKVLERIVDDLPPFEHFGEQLGVYAPELYKYGKWKNIQLLKDCGLVPYYLAKIIDAKPVMYFGSKVSDYPYLNDISGMEMLYHENEYDLECAYKNFLLNNYTKMDVLVLYGMYNESLSYLDAYRQLRPDGKVYCGLDMNSWWMNGVLWDSEPAKQFASQSDVIATSCRLVRDSLNRNPNVHFPCRWFTNGFFNPTGKPVVANAEKKDNIILTVGRIGTKQKNNEELLAAFAQVSDVLNGWCLHLVGPIEPDFDIYINNYYQKYPHLKEKVIFTGSIVDKAALYDEYTRAKIFVITSKEEGGTPNVYAEALFHGCMFVTSDIDGADDITNYGELGAVYTSGDVKGLTDALLNVCSDADVNAFQQHIPKNLAYANKYYDWNRNAKKLAYMLFK